MEHRAYGTLRTAQQRIVEDETAGFHAEPESIVGVIEDNTELTQEMWRKHNLLSFGDLVFVASIP